MCNVQGIWRPGIGFHGAVNGFRFGCFCQYFHGIVVLVFSWQSGYFFFQVVKFEFQVPQCGLKLLHQFTITLSSVASSQDSRSHGQPRGACNPCEMQGSRAIFMALRHVSHLGQGLHDGLWGLLKHRPVSSSGVVNQTCSQGIGVQPPFQQSHSKKRHLEDFQRRPRESQGVLLNSG